MSADTEPLPAGRTDYDTGDVLAVPDGDQLEHDDFVPAEVNSDEFQDLTVPEGEVHLMSTAYLDEFS